MDKREARSKKHEARQNEVGELKEALQRERADFMNFRRRSEEDRLELTSLIKKEIILELLPLIDNLARAAGHLPKDLESNEWARGVLQIENQALAVFRDMGVQRIEAVGQPFDPRLHEAMSFEGGKGSDEVV